MTSTFVVLCLFGQPDSQTWCWQPVEKHELPEVGDASWSDDPVDRFVLARLEEAGLEPAPSADRRALIRRLSFSLRGLPPSPEESDAFVRDASPDAYENLVDRFLSSPHFGERWARHWMDVVRFGETYGNEWNFEVRGAWRYRDYLIRAFNQDLPYDQLVREHIAGDLLEPRWNREEQINESLIGTTFYRFGEAGHDDCLGFKEIGLDVLDNQIDTISKAFQGLTVACARCHDHKLDTISTKDYYALSGIVHSARYVNRTIDAPGINDQRKARLRELKARIRRELAAEWLRDVEDVGRYLHAAQLQKERADTDSVAAGLDAKRLKRVVALITPEKQDKKTKDKAKKKDAQKKKKKKERGLEDPLYPWLSISNREDAKAGDVGTAWKKLAGRYEKESRQREEFNARNFIDFGDVGAGRDGSWSVEGHGLDGPSPSGELVVSPEGEKVARAVLPAGMYTHTLSDRLNGALRSPFLPKDKKFISVEVVGGNQSAYRIIYDNCHLGQEYNQLKWDEPRWVTKPTKQEHPESHIYIALVTKFDNQCYPTRQMQKRVDPFDIRSYFGVTRALLHDGKKPPRAELRHMKRLFREAAPATVAEMAARYTEAARQAVRGWSEDKASDDNVRWISWLLQNGLLTNSTKATESLEQLVERYREVERGIPAPKIVSSMADLDDGFDVPLKVRGDPENLGEPVPRRYLTALSGTDHGFETRGSGRDELAELIASPQNPLTARVMVNRVWHHLFGAGIVRTTDDFGEVGDRPSHPRLLDYLAARFVEEGWSVKKLVRSLVLTRTYRMASRQRAAARTVDPENRLLHRYPLRRLEAEAIRDAILSISGRLDPTLYGRSIHPYRFKQRPTRRLFSGPLDGDGRRSIYTKVTLTEEPPFLAVFNLPEAKVARGRRDRTNVPAQALTLLNDPFVLQQAEVWAARMVTEAVPSVSSRIERIFLLALGRPADLPERERFERAVDGFASLHGVPAAKVPTSVAVWKDVAHAIFNLKEFLYVR